VHTRRATTLFLGAHMRARGVALLQLRVFANCP
jgi:hypothetical protein